MSERANVRIRYGRPSRDPVMWFAVGMQVFLIAEFWPNPAAICWCSLMVGLLVGFMLGWGRS